MLCEIRARGLKLHGIEYTSTEVRQMMELNLTLSVREETILVNVR